MLTNELTNPFAELANINFDNGRGESFNDHNFDMILSLTYKELERPHKDEETHLIVLRNCSARILSFFARRHAVWSRIQEGGSPLNPMMEWGYSGEAIQVKNESADDGVNILTLKRQTMVEDSSIRIPYSMTGGKIKFHPFEITNIERVSTDASKKTTVSFENGVITKFQIDSIFTRKDGSTYAVSGKFVDYTSIVRRATS